MGGHEAQVGERFVDEPAGGPGRAAGVEPGNQLAGPGGAPGLALDQREHQQCQADDVQQPVDPLVVLQVERVDRERALERAVTPLGGPPRAGATVGSGLPRPGHAAYPPPGPGHPARPNERRDTPPRKATVHALLAAATPADPADPATWPDWRKLLPHLLASDALHSDNPQTRDLLVQVARSLNNSGDARTALSLIQPAVTLWTETLGTNAGRMDHEAQLARLHRGDSVTTFLRVLKTCGERRRARSRRLHRGAPRWPPVAARPPTRSSGPATTCCCACSSGRLRPGRAGLTAA